MEPSIPQDTNCNFPEEEKQSIVFNNAKWMKFNNTKTQKTNTVFLCQLGEREKWYIVKGPSEAMPSKSFLIFFSIL